MEEQIRKLLLSAGFVTEMRGYAYLTTAIRLCIESPSYLERPLKYLYTEVGNHYGVAARNVERALRSSVTLLWESERGYRPESLPGKYSFYSREYVTNKVVISHLIEAVNSGAFGFTE